MVTLISLLPVLIALFLQSGDKVVLPASPDTLTPSERAKLEGETDIEARVRLYEAVSTRHLRAVEEHVKTEEFEKLPPQLQAWADVISASRVDAEKHISRKKKSRALIRYEIHLRKAIGDVRALKFKLPTEIEAVLLSWIEKAEEARTKFVEILFPS
jgi:hypothetical protein